MTGSPAAQIPLDLGHRVALGREDFMIAPCNQDAVGWIDRWPEWPAPALVLIGPAGSGKSHLAAVWKNMARAQWVDASTLHDTEAGQINGRGLPLVIDHFDPWIGDRIAETALFHLYNLAKEQSSTMLITMRTAPGQIAFALPDLSSRLRAAPVAEIRPPDDVLLAALLVKLFADRQLSIGTDVLSYVLPRMTRSFSAAHDIVGRADHLALSEKKPVTVPLMRRVLSEQG